jgi:hypothetical protein
MSMAESSQAYFVSYSSQDLCSQNTSFNILVEYEPNPMLLTRCFAHLTALIIGLI